MWPTEPERLRRTCRQHSCSSASQRNSSQGSGMSNKYCPDDQFATRDRVPDPDFESPRCPNRDHPAPTTRRWNLRVDVEAKGRDNDRDQRDQTNLHFRFHIPFLLSVFSFCVCFWFNCNFPPILLLRGRKFTSLAFRHHYRWPTARNGRHRK